jgi:hypothetical protein
VGWSAGTGEVVVAEPIHLQMQASCTPSLNPFFLTSGSSESTQRSKSSIENPKLEATQAKIGREFR